MTSVWLHRPRLMYLGLFSAAYVLGCGFAQSLAIVPGTGISIWPPAGLFIATLVLASGPSWPWWVGVGCLSELAGNALWFHSPLPAAVLIYAGNALEAMAGAWLVHRFCGRPVRLETLREVLVFVVMGAGAAPVVSATVGSATLAWFGIQSQSFTAAWPLWWIGDATGVLIVAPLALVVFQNWRGAAALSAKRWGEASVLGLIFLGVAALSLSGYLPFAYMIMPPLLWASVRFEFKGAAITLALLALITAVFTISGASQFAGDPESQKEKQVMLHLFLAISAFSALIVAAISRQHQQALVTLRQNVDALRDREWEFSQLVGMVPSHLWRLNPDGEPIFFNRRMVEFLGMDVPDTDKPGMSRLEALSEAVHPEEAEKFRGTLRRSLATGEPFRMRYRLRRFDGAYRWMSSAANPLRDEGQRIVQWYGLCHDIDDQVRAEEALRERERGLQELVDAMPVNILSFSPSGKMTYASKRYLEQVGSPLSHIEDFNALAKDLAHPDDFPTMFERASNGFANGEAFVNRFRRRDKQGVYRWIEARAQPLRDSSGAIVQWYIASIDIEDEVRAQEALRAAHESLARQSQAASLAELSATIAHEVNQPLAAIVANSHACHRWLSADPPNLDRAKITAERIIRDANSAAEVIGRVRALFRHSPQARSPEDVNRLISEVCRLMADEITAKVIRLETNLNPGLPLVALDRVQVQQVMVNLLRNGIEAMDGLLDGVRTLWISSCRDGTDAIRVEVTDSGGGFADAERVFEPFFTTKQQGMGMGLAICRSIVESHGGRLWAVNNDDRGGTVAFTLPLAVTETS